MNSYYPYGFRWFQGGGSVLPGILVGPREMAQYMGGRGDIGGSSGVPTRSQVEGQIKQGEIEKEQLKKKLKRVGYKGAHARAMMSKGKSKMPENVKKQLENLEASDYRVAHHPDFDPSRPVEDQQYLNNDNSFRTTVLRGANMFTDSGDPIIDFIAGAMTTPGRSFANLTMDAENRYVKPGLTEGLGNFFLDVIGIAPTATASYVTEKAVPAARNVLGQAYKVNPWAKGNVFNRWNADNYFRIVDDAAYKDALESGVIRSNPGGDVKGAMDALSNKLGRPTAFPSFARGAPDVTYLPKEGNGYIIESTMPMFKRGDVNPVTGNVIKGRHWAYRPINMTTGETMESIPLNQVNIYRPHWLKGYEVADDAAAGSWVMNRGLVGTGLPKESMAMERELLRSWRPLMNEPIKPASVVEPSVVDPKRLGVHEFSPIQVMGEGSFDDAWYHIDPSDYEYIAQTQGQQAAMKMARKDAGDHLLNQLEKNEVDKRQLLLDLFSKKYRLQRMGGPVGWQSVPGMPIVWRDYLRLMR